MLGNKRSGASCLSVLVLVQGQGIGAVLVMIDTVLALLPELKVLVEGALHHHLFAAACADTSDVTLCIYHQYLQEKEQNENPGGTAKASS